MPDEPLRYVQLSLWKVIVGAAFDGGYRIETDLKTTYTRFHELGIIDDKCRYLPGLTSLRPSSLPIKLPVPEQFQCMVALQKRLQIKPLSPPLLPEPPAAPVLALEAPEVDAPEVDEDAPNVGRGIPIEVAVKVMSGCSVLSEDFVDHLRVAFRDDVVDAALMSSRADHSSSFLNTVVSDSESSSGTYIAVATRPLTFSLQTKMTRSPRSQRNVPS